MGPSTTQLQLPKLATFCTTTSRPPSLFSRFRPPHGSLRLKQAHHRTIPGHRCFSISRSSYNSPPSDSSSPLPAKPATRRNLRRVTAVLFLLLGAFNGTQLANLFNPTRIIPPRDSPLDADCAAAIRQLYHETGFPRHLEHSFSPDDWQFIDVHAMLPPSQRAHHLLSEQLLGHWTCITGANQSWIRTEKASAANDPTVLTSVLLGPSVWGWPFTTHGGALATLLDETLARAAFREWGQGATGVTAKLKITYTRPVQGLLSARCVVEARALREEELDVAERGKRGYKMWVVGRVVDSVTGKVFCEGEALFVRRDT